MGAVCSKINGYTSSTSSLALGGSGTFTVGTGVPFPWDNDVK